MEGFCDMGRTCAWARGRACAHTIGAYPSILPNLEVSALKNKANLVCGRIATGEKRSFQPFHPSNSAELLSHRAKKPAIVLDAFAERGFAAIAGFFDRLHAPAFTISQSVSIARALRPYLEHECWRRQVQGGKSKSCLLGEALKVREFVARCSGLAPRTLAQAEAVIEAAECNPRSSTLRALVREMDTTHRVGPAFRSLKEFLQAGRILSRSKKPRRRRNGTEFGEKLIAELMSAAVGSGVSR